MNSLSLLIYMASVVSGLSAVCFITAMVFGLMLFVRVIYYTTECMHLYSYDTTEEKEKKKNFKIIPNKWFLIAPVTLLTMAALLPDKETVYLIAASEAGEYMATSKEGQEIFEEMTKTIKDQLKGLQTND